MLDWYIQFEIPWESEGGDFWEIERDGIQVKTDVLWRAINRAEQTFKEIITLEVNDHGKKLNIVGEDIRRAIYPQEFLFLISGLKHFEFIGWWNNWNLSKPLEHATNIKRPIALVRRI